MALDLLGASESGATAKTKINAAITEVDQNAADITAAFEQIDLNASVEYVNENVIQDFSGTTAPDNGDGKEGDRYHRFTTVGAGSTLVDSVSVSDFVDTSFALFRDPNALAGQVSHIVMSEGNSGFIIWKDAHPNFETLSMSFEGGVARLIEVVSETATSVGFTLDATSQTQLSAVVVGDAFTLEESGVLTGKDAEYVKIHDGAGNVTWQRLLPATPSGAGEYKLVIDGSGNPTWAAI